MSDIFISYAHEDRERAKNMAAALEARGWSVWWDRKIITGQTYDQVIENELDAAKAVVVLWSQHSVASEWVKNEAAAAAERGVLAPAMIEQIKLPLEFRRKQTADLISWHSEPAHSGFQALCEGLSAIITGKALPIKEDAAQAPPFSRKPLWKLGWKWIIACLLVIAMSSGTYWLIVRNTSKQTVGMPVNTASYRQDIYNQLGRDQHEALDVLKRDKAAAIGLVDKNMTAIDKALQSFPNDPDFLVLKGYAAKNIYQSSKNVLDADRRRRYLIIARKSFEKAMEMDSDNAGAHNGMGNVYFFEGRFDEAIKEHDFALQLTNGRYPAAEHDKKIVERVKSGELAFDF